MNYLFLSFFILTLSVSATFAEDQTTDDTMTTLENSQTTDSLLNKSLPTDQKETIPEKKQTKSRSKWDFSDHREDKKTSAKKTAEKIQNNKKYGQNNNLVKPKEHWTLDKTKQTWKFPSSETSNNSGDSK
jgi:hypothetical protein